MAKILVVDDDRDLSDVLRTLLESVGHQVEDARHPREALAMLGLEPKDAKRPLPDVILLDVMLPWMDGFAVCGRIRADERTKELPVIFLTGRYEDQASGPKTYLIRKPFEPDRLFRLIREILSK